MKISKSKSCPDCGETKGWKIQKHTCYLDSDCVLVKVVRCLSCGRFEGYDKNGKLLQVTRGTEKGQNHGGSMKIYKLGRVGDDGKKAFYDEATGFVVRAESAAVARQIASKKPGDEKAEFWLNPKKSYCKVVESSKRSQIILRAFDAG